jgi:hypothetical protein
VPRPDSAEFPFDETLPRSPNGKRQIPIDAGTWQWPQKLRLHGESVSDCIIRVMVVSQHKRGLL